MGDTSETNTKVVSGELFFGVVALTTPIQKIHYMRDKDPFPRYRHILLVTQNLLVNGKKRDVGMLS